MTLAELIEALVDLAATKPLDTPVHGYWGGTDLYEAETTSVSFREGEVVLRFNT